MKLRPLENCARTPDIRRLLVAINVLILIYVAYLPSMGLKVTP